MKYTVIIERAGKNYSGYVPDLPGCVAAAATPARVKKLLLEAVEFHLEGLRADGVRIPKPSAKAATVHVKAKPKGSPRKAA